MENKHFFYYTIFNKPLIFAIDLLIQTISEVTVIVNKEFLINLSPKN